jgi:hypothetical protein
MFISSELKQDRITSVLTSATSAGQRTPHFSNVRQLCECFSEVLCVSVLVKSGLGNEITAVRDPPH